MSQASAPLRYEAHASFLRLLDAAGCTLAISVYMQSRVVLVSVSNGVPQIDAFQFPRPMGIVNTFASPAPINPPRLPP